MHSNVASLRSTHVVFQKLSFAIQNGFNNATYCPCTFYPGVLILYIIKNIYTKNKIIMINNV
jgi:hypothetical protein